MAFCIFMYLRAILQYVGTYQISVDFYYVPVGGRGGLEWGGGGYREGERNYIGRVRVVISGPKKVSIFRATPPPQMPLVTDSLPSKPLRTAPYKRKVH
jgi:hypothetical protein